MTRGAKKFVYGILYLLIFGFLFYWIFGGSGATSRDDLSVMRGEVVPLAVRGPVRLFKSGDFSRIVLLAEISNKNAEYGVGKLDYVFTLYDANGALVNRARGSDMMFPKETKFVLASYEGTSYDIQRTSRAGLDLSPEWVPGSMLLGARLAVDGQSTTTITSDGIRVEGSVRNASPLTTGAVKVIALLYNRYGDPIFGGQTLLERVGSLSSVPFSVYFPPDPALVAATDGSKTRVLVSVEE